MAQIRAGSDGKWEEVHTIVSREKGSEKIKAEQHLAELLTKFLDLPPPKGSQVSQVWLDNDKAQRNALSRFWEGMRQ
jgi:hypothetical protein